MVSKSTPENQTASAQNHSNNGNGTTPEEVSFPGPSDLRHKPRSVDGDLAPASAQRCTLHTPVTEQMLRMVANCPLTDWYFPLPDGELTFTMDEPVANPELYEFLSAFWLELHDKALACIQEGEEDYMVEREIRKQDSVAVRVRFETAKSLERRNREECDGIEQLQNAA